MSSSTNTPVYLSKVSMPRVIVATSACILVAGITFLSIAPTLTSAFSITSGNPSSSTSNCIDTEFNTAYEYARPLNITTMPSCEKAMLDGTLIRMHAAKMLVNFALSHGLAPDMDRTCTYSDIANLDMEMQGYIIQACQMGIMGVKGDGMPDTMFNPMMELDKAQLATILSRMIYGPTYNTDASDPMWYAQHVQAVKDVGVLTVTTDLLQPIKRGRAILMLMRAQDLFGRDSD